MNGPGNSRHENTGASESRVAALFVAKGGVYFDIPGVDPWDEERDARLYAGPWPVVAHPPCNHWCQLASVNAARYESFEIGADDGCFAAALEAVLRFGGVLEHPAPFTRLESVCATSPDPWRVVDGFHRATMGD